MMVSEPPAHASPSAPTAEPAAPFPWPPQSGEPFTEAAGRTWRQSVFQPASFFREMPRGSAARAALLYYVMLGILVEGIHLFWRFILGPPSLEMLPGNDLLRDFGGGANPLTPFLLSPLYLLLAVLLTAAVSHAFLAVLRGGAHGFRTTLSVFCFAYGPALLAVIPRIGAPIGGVWMLVIAIIGLREAHGTTGAKAAAAVLGPMFLAFTIAFVMLLIAMAGILGGV